MKNKLILPDKEIRLMLHTLGISHDKNGDYIQANKRYSPYPTSYRNYYQVEQFDMGDKLVKLGYAKFQINVFNLPCYHITYEGRLYLKSLGYKWHERKKR